MSKDILINKIINMPSQFRNLGNISMYSLLKESGYFEIYDQVSEKDIIEGLNKHPECIDDWLMLSEDKRTNPSWCFTKGNEKYTVGYYPPTEDCGLTTYTNAREACDAFIKREIENIRGI